MAGYVKRINDATLRVPIGGIRIGSAKYSRLAQINLHTHIITFSRYAIENVPERGRRYLVIHELSHVKEASHNKRFWQLVADHEPKYKEIGKELDQAFKLNVREDQQRSRRKGLIYQTRLFPASRTDDWENFREALGAPPRARKGNNCLDNDDNNDPDHNIYTEDDIAAHAKIVESNTGLYYPLDSGVISDPANELYECNDDELNSWESLEGGIVHGGSEGSEMFDEDYFDHG